MLNISEFERMSIMKLTSLKSRVENIDYIILDEVSMLGLRDLYKISAQLSKAKDKLSLPYGGVNMIFQVTSLSYLLLANLLPYTAT